MGGVAHAGQADLRRVTPETADVLLARGLLREAGFVYSELTASDADPALIRQAWITFEAASELVAMARAQHDVLRH